MLKHLELESDNCRGMLKWGRPYTLCLGAGIDYGIMPNWKDLALSMLREIVNPKISQTEFDELLNKLSWSLDSIIQASLNFVVAQGGNVETFNDTMQNLLYKDIIQKARTFGVEAELKRFISNPFKRTNSDIPQLSDFFQVNYQNTSLYKLCQFLLDASDSGNPPKAILTFNADVLLHSLLTLMQLKRTYDLTGSGNTADFRYKAVHHIIESDGHKIPIYHVHGSIVPNIGKREARQNLVFPEATYHSLSGSTHSWQQTIFQYYSLRSRMIFIGMSMSDSNVRRWLSHVNTVLTNDITNIKKEKVNTSNHIWMTPQSTSETERQIKKLGLIHLGVKVGEIQDWTKLSAALRNLAL